MHEVEGAGISQRELKEPVIRGNILEVSQNLTKRIESFNVLVRFGFGA